MLAATRDKGVPFRHVFRLLRPSGSINWLEAYATVVRTDDDANDRLVGTLRDITERKLLEQRLAEAEKFESIGAMAAGLAHDFNNLLTGVIGSASLVQDMLPSHHDARSLLANIVTAGERGAAITSQMLSYAGKSIFISGRVNLSVVAREAIAPVLRGLQPKIKVTLNTAPEVEVVGDARQLREVITNLLTNATEAVEGGGEVSVTLCEQEIDQPAIDRDPRLAALNTGRYARLEVRDTGNGIEPKILPRVFDPFFSTKFQGRGLGLAAVLGIVRAHRGDVHLSSRVGQGTTVFVLLPATAKPEPQPSRPPARAVTRGSATVLVVDDERQVADLVSKILQSRGFTVKVANSGQTALEILAKKEEPVSIVLLDLTMPVMSGQETLRRIREIDRDLPVVLTSGYTRDQALSQVEAREVAGFLQKPYQAKVLVEHLSRFLGGHSKAAT